MRWHDATRLRPLCSVSDRVSAAAQYVAKGRLLASSIRSLWRSCPRSALSCAHQPLLGQLRLFGGVRCYRHSLHTDGIETQKLGETICDVPTAESIQHRGLSVGRDLCKKLVDIGADPASGRNILPGDEDLLVLHRRKIDVAQCDLLGRPAEVKTAALADRCYDHALTGQRDQQLANKTRVCAQALGQSLDCTSEAILIRERHAQHHLQRGRKASINHRVTSPQQRTRTHSCENVSDMVAFIDLN